MGWTKVEEVGVEDMIVFLAGRSQAHVSQGFFSFFVFYALPATPRNARDGKILSCIWMLVKRKEYKKEGMEMETGEDNWMELWINQRYVKYYHSIV